MFPPQQHQQPQQIAGTQDYGAYDQNLAIHSSTGGGIVANDPRFSQEVVAIRSKLIEIEGTIKTISLQNAQLIRENKFLWSEMLKTIKKSERKVEKLILFIFSLLRPSLSKVLGSNTGMFKKIITDLARKNFKNISGWSNENNKMIKEENNEDSKNEISDAVALFKESFDDSINPELENFLKNYLNLMQKANSANSKTESTKLMEDYFNFLQGKDKQQAPQQGNQQQQQQQYLQKENMRSSLLECDHTINSSKLYINEVRTRMVNLLLECLDPDTSEEVKEISGNKLKKELDDLLCPKKVREDMKGNIINSENEERMGEEMLNVGELEDYFVVENPMYLEQENEDGFIIVNSDK